jgi:tetratricopeptide (TPR) repeat protein
LKAQNGDETSEAADLYAHLGMVYRGSMVDNADVDHAKEDFEHSKSAYLKALTIRKKVLSPSHPELAATYSFLADLYDDRGANDEASKLRARGSRLMEDNNLQVTAFPLPSAIYPPRCNSWSDF